MTVLRHIVVFCLFLLAAIGNGYFFDYLNARYFHYPATDNNLGDFSGIGKAFMIIVIAPVAETAFLNLLPNVLLTRLRVRNTALLILIPSALFSLMHWYPPLYVAMTFFAGMILNGYYLYCQRRTKDYFVLVALLHAAYNAYGYFIVN